MTSRLLNDSRIHMLLLIIIPFLVYSQILTFSLTGSDDKALLANINTSVSKGISAFNIINAPYIFDTGLFYRPIVTASFYLTTLFTNQLTMHYLINIIIHLLSVILFYLLLLGLKVNKPASLFISLIFSINPVLVNSIAWLPGRNDSLLALFFLVSFLLLIKYLNNKSILLLAGHILFLLCAFFTKETALLSLLVFGSYLLLSNKGKESKINYSLFILWGLSALTWYLFRGSVIHQVADLELFSNIKFVVQAAGKILLPAELNVLPVVKDTSLVYGFLSLILLIVLYFYTPKENKKLYLFGIVTFFVFLIPALININPEYSANLMLESRLYLPAIGLFVSLSQIEFLQKSSVQNLSISISSLIITGVFCYSTVSYSQNYKNELYFWNNAVVRSPSLDLSFSGLGLHYLQKENFEEAIVNYKSAVELNPQKGEYYLKIAYCYNRLNNTDGTEEYYRKALNIYPDDHDANLILGIICYKKKNYADAEKYLAKASASNIKDFQPDLYLLRLYYDTGMFLKAKAMADKLKDNNIKIPSEIEKRLYQF